MTEDNKFDNRQQAISDPHNFVYIIFFWLGIGSLLPWNIFISVSDYWLYKFRTVENVTDPVSGYIVSDFPLVSGNISGNSSNQVPIAVDQAGGGLNDTQKYWFSYLAVASMIPNLIFLTLTALIGHRFSLQKRLYTSLVVVISCFIFTTAMSVVDTDLWQQNFLYITLASVMLINCSCAVFQGGLLGVAGMFPAKYIGGVFSGQALGGLFASSINVLMIILGASPVQTGFWCFVIAVVFMLSALVAYFTVGFSEFFRFYVCDNIPDHTEDMSKAPVEGQAEMQVMSMQKCRSPFVIIQDVLPLAVAIFITFFVTLSCYPALTVVVKSTLLPSADGVEGSNHVQWVLDWADRYFTPVCCFVLFNLGDFCGRFVAERIQKPSVNSPHGSFILVALSFARLMFIPLFIVCNANPTDRHMTPILIHSDNAFIFLMALFSLSNGYISSMCMMLAPQKVSNPEEQQVVATMMVAILAFGLSIGSVFSGFLVTLI